MPMLADVMGRVAKALQALAERVDELERQETYYGTIDLSGYTLAVLSNTTLDGNGHTLTLSADTTLSGAPAPANAKYIVQQTNSGLSAEQALGALATGILKNTTSTGVLSIATGSDLPSHTHAGADIASGTVAPARLGSGTPSASTLLFGDGTWAGLVAADIPNLDAAKITSGTLATAQIPNLDGAKITSGTVGAARLGAGTVNSTTFLRGDGSWTNTLGGHLGLSAGNCYFVGGTQVLAARRTGWAAWTGSATRTSKATSTATLANVAEALKALIDDLIAHGIIGA